ncbi:unnamed protein product, partial [Cylicostephanus goldi]
AHSAHETRRRSIGSDNASTGRKRADSLHEVLRLLETGAMPSQYIEASPPRPLLARRSASATLRQDLRELKESEIWGTAPLQVDVSDSSRVASDLNIQLEVPSIPRSECSGLSDSPDRLVICDDEELNSLKEPLVNVVDAHVPYTAPEIVPESLVSPAETTLVAPLAETVPKTLLPPPEVILVPPLAKPVLKTVLPPPQVTLVPPLANTESHFETPKKRPTRKKSLTSLATPTTRKRSVKGQNAEVVSETAQK